MSAETANPWSPDVFIKNLMATIYSIGTFALTLFGFQVTKEGIKAPSLKDFVIRVVELFAVAVVVYMILKYILGKLL